MPKLRGGMVMSNQMEDREFDNFIQKTAEEQIAILKERCKDFDTTIQDLQIKLQRLKELEARRKKRKQIVKKANAVDSVTESNIPVTEKTAKPNPVQPYLDKIHHIIDTDGYNFEQIVQVLPAKDSVDFTSIMNAIILDIQKQYSFFTTYSLETRNSSQEKLSEEELQSIANLEDLRDMLIDYRDEEKEKEQTPNQNETSAVIIPLLSRNGNNLLINDLKQLTREQYPYILKLLQELEREDFTHSKQLSTNSELSGYRELRNLTFYIRILYKSLGNHQYAVLGLFYKNSDNIMGLINSMDQRAGLFETQKDHIEELLHNQDSDFMTVMNQEYTDLKKHLGEENVYGTGINRSEKSISG